MSAPAPRTTRALVRRLTGVHDPLALFAALRQAGHARHFFRRTGGRAFIGCDFALRLEASGNEARLDALSEGGEVLRPAVAATCGTFAKDGRTFRFPASGGHADEQERMEAASALDLVSAMTGAIGGGEEEVFAPAAFGLVGFEAVEMGEQLPPLPPGDFPDLFFELAETLIVVEASGAARLVALAAGSEAPEVAHRQHHLAVERLSRLAARVEQARCPPLDAPPSSRAEVDIDDAQFAATVRRLKEHVAAGDAFQVVPSRTFRAPCADPLAAFRRLVAADPSRLNFFLDTPHGILFGASPEPAIELHDGRLALTPMAGTRPRANTPDADDRTEAELRLDAKEVAEHLMLVDLARNDVARIAKTGTRRVSSLMRVERFARVMHLASTVEGQLPPQRGLPHAIRACLPVGTLSGAPKLKAIELIRSVEGRARGPYGGAVGLLDARGNFDSAVVIRSALVRDGVALVRAGAGVVLDSDPAAEAAETRAKARAVLDALGASA